MVATSYGILYLDVEPKSQNLQTPETSCFWRKVPSLGRL